MQCTFDVPTFFSSLGSFWNQTVLRKPKLGVRLARLKGTAIDNASDKMPFLTVSVYTKGGDTSIHTCSLNINSSYRINLQKEGLKGDERYRRVAPLRILKPVNVPVPRGGNGRVDFTVGEMKRLADQLFDHTVLKKDRALQMVKDRGYPNATLEEDGESGIGDVFIRIEYLDKELIVDFSKAQTDNLINSLKEWPGKS